MSKRELIKNAALVCAAILCLCIAIAGCKKKPEEKPVVPVTLESVAVTTPPTKTIYNVDDKFDPAGMVVTATYSDNSKAPVTVTETMISYDFKTAGTKTVTITVTEKGITKTATVDGITVLLFSGAGTSGDPYQIGTPADLALLAELVNADNTDYNNKYYKLTADIDLSAYGAGFNEGKGWIPIGFDGGGINDKPFIGNFDGGGFKVSGLYINDSDPGGAGLFGYVYDGTIANLGVTGADITCGEYNTGGVVGIVWSGSVTNCYATGVVKGNNQVGGVVGYAFYSSITNCYATGTVSGVYHVGGVVGSVDGRGSITNCYATGAVSGYQFVGGVTGFNNGSLINCVALNPSITREGSDTYYTTFGRVAGYNSTGTLSNNVALENMAALGGITFGTGAHDNENGANITAAEAKQQATYEALGWDFSTVWQIDEGAALLMINANNG